MDPVSFTASLVTLIGAVGVSARLMRKLHTKFKNVPKDVQSLSQQIKNFEDLLQELRAQLQDCRNTATPAEGLLEVWESSISLMYRDIADLQTTLCKLQPLLQKRSLSSSLRLRARKILSEEQVEEYQGKLNGHCGFVANIQVAVCR